MRCICDNLGAHTEEFCSQSGICAPDISAVAPALGEMQETVSGEGRPRCGCPQVLTAKVVGTEGRHRGSGFTTQWLWAHCRPVCIPDRRESRVVGVVALSRPPSCIATVFKSLCLIARSWHPGSRGESLIDSPSTFDLTRSGRAGSALVQSSPEIQTVAAQLGGHESAWFLGSGCWWPGLC